MAAGVKTLCKQIDEMCWENPKLSPIAIRLLRVTVATLNESAQGPIQGKKKTKRLPPLREEAKGRSKASPPQPVLPPVMQRGMPGENVTQIISQRNDELAPLLNSHHIRYTSSALLQDDTPHTPEMVSPQVPAAYQNSQSDCAYHYNHQAESFSAPAPTSPAFTPASELNSVKVPSVPTPSAPVLQPLNHHHKHQLQIGIGGEPATPTSKKPAGFLRHLRELRGGPSTEEVAERERKQKEWLNSLEEQIRENQERKKREHDIFMKEERKWQERDPSYTIRSTAYDHRHIISG